MLRVPDDFSVGEAIQQLADRLGINKVHMPAVHLLRDKAAHADVDPSGCALLPQVNVLWGLEGTPPLVSLFRPHLYPAEHAALRRVWDGAIRCYLSGHRTTSLTKAFEMLPRHLTVWMKKLTGMYPYKLRHHPDLALLAVSALYANESWCYHSDGIEFVSPINGHLVVIRGDEASTFQGVQRFGLKEWVSIPSTDHRLAHLPSVGTGSVLRALLEQALFIDDHHTLRIAHMLEAAGLSLEKVAEFLETRPPRPPQATPRDLVAARPSHAHKPLQELLGVSFDVPARSLADQIDVSLLQEEKPGEQEVCVAQLYRYVVEQQRLMTTGRFTAAVARTVPMGDWLNAVPIGPRTLRRWLYRSNFNLNNQ